MAPVLTANQADVDRAAAAGRSTTRLVLSEPMRAAMIEGLRAWRDSPLRRDGAAEPDEQQNPPQREEQAEAQDRVTPQRAHPVDEAGGLARFAHGSESTFGLVVQF